MRAWGLVVVLVGCGGGVAMTETTDPDPVDTGPPIVQTEPSAPRDAGADADPEPDACTLPKYGPADDCTIQPGTCGDGGMVVTCVSSGMVAWPADEHDERLPCEQTDFSDGGLRPVYCCPVSCIRVRKNDCSACGGPSAMLCPDGTRECR